MRCQSLVLLVVAVASVSAYPNNLVKREDYVYDKNGNLKLTFSDERINLSGITIDNIADKLADVCSESGQCQTNEIEMDAKIPDRVLTIGPTGAYPTERREDLITALELAVNEVAECKDVKHKVDCPNPMVYCPDNDYTVNECLVPKYWGINYQPDDDDNDSAPPYIGVDLKLEVEDNGFCKIFTTVGGAIAGAVHGVGGGVFSLLSLACED